MNNTQLLVVAPVGWHHEVLSQTRCYTLHYCFVEEFPHDGLSAWRTSTTPNSESIDVAAPCRGYSGGYRLHALNRFFAQALLRVRPEMVVISGLFGCTVDLLRVAEILGVPSTVFLGEPAEPIEALDPDSRGWLRSAIASCQIVVPPVEPVAKKGWPSDWLVATQSADSRSLVSRVGSLIGKTPPDYSYDYSIYEFCQRDHSLLVTMQQGDTRHFSGCKSVLDLACGVGIFLDCLRQRGITGTGVERDTRVVRYGRGMGLDIHEEDALAYLQNTSDAHDGIYCSHFVEHLPVDGVLLLLRLLAERMTVDGVLVLVFPDPESIRSQLLGFWRDPEHMRFYHPELIVSMAATAGLELVWSSYDDQPHTVVPFSGIVPPMPEMAMLPALGVREEAKAPGILEKLLSLFGLATQGRQRELEERLYTWSAGIRRTYEQNMASNTELEARTRTLWQLNQTWAWNDNVTLKLRKVAS